MGSPNIPWHRIKADYVEGVVDERTGERRYPHLRELASVYQCDSSTVRQRSASENWVGQRATFQANVDRRRQEKRIRQLTDDAVELDTYAVAVAKAGLRLVQHRVGEITSRAAEAQQAGGRASGIEATEQVSLSGSATKWYQLGQLALGRVPSTTVEDLGKVDLYEPLDVELQRLVREVKEAEAAEAVKQSPNGNGQHP